MRILRPHIRLVAKKLVTPPDAYVHWKVRTSYVRNLKKDMYIVPVVDALVRCRRYDELISLCLDHEKPVMQAWDFHITIANHGATTGDIRMLKVAKGMMGPTRHYFPYQLALEHNNYSAFKILFEWDKPSVKYALIDLIGRKWVRTSDSPILRRAVRFITRGDATKIPSVNPIYYGIDAVRKLEEWRKQL